MLESSQVVSLNVHTPWGHPVKKIVPACSHNLIFTCNQQLCSSFCRSVGRSAKLPKPLIVKVLPVIYQVVVPQSCAQSTATVTFNLWAWNFQWRSSVSEVVCVCVWMCELVYECTLVVTAIANLCLFDYRKLMTWGEGWTQLVNWEFCLQAELPLHHHRLVQCLHPCGCYINP